MIITEQKPAEEILEMLADYDSLFIVGCGECATECQTGGEYEVNEMSQRLTEAGKTITGTVVPDQWYRMSLARSWTWAAGCVRTKKPLLLLMLSLCCLVAPAPRP